MDISPHAVKAAIANAEEAGVDDCSQVRLGDAEKIGETDFAENEGGIVVTNPPYGERIGDRKSIDRIYDAFRTFFSDNPTWSLFLVTSDKTAEKIIFLRKACQFRSLCGLEL